MSDSYIAHQSHPYGVMPQGNAFFAAKNILSVRLLGLGILSCIGSDEVIIEILGLLNGAELLAMSSVSKALYVFSSFSDLWRDLSLRLEAGPIEFHKSWRQTFLIRLLQFTNRDPSRLREHTPIKVDGIFSNFLYRSWSCSTCDLATACPGFFTFNDIERRNAADLSVEDFVAQYEQQNIPVILTNAVQDWPALGKWTKNYLVESCKSKTFRATAATAPAAASFTMEQYFIYAESTNEEVPLYLFERNFADSVPILEEDYKVPAYFSPTAAHGTDLFRHLGVDRRPDYRWLIAGPARSGSIFHIDPNQTNAWNVAVSGRKKWIFYPPGVPPPGVVSSPDGADVAVPLSTGEWLLAFWSHHLEARKTWAPDQRPLEAILNPGELMFVPHGYWHMVVNIDDCVALTHNYVSTSNLADCLRFLRETPDQISGVRDRPGQAVQPEHIYEEFVEKLRHVLPGALLEETIAQSLHEKGIDAGGRGGRGVKRRDHIHTNKALRGRMLHKRRKALNSQPGQASQRLLAGTVGTTHSTRGCIGGSADRREVTGQAEVPCKSVHLAKSVMGVTMGIRSECVDAVGSSEFNSVDGCSMVARLAAEGPEGSRNVRESSAPIEQKQENDETKHAGPQPFFCFSFDIPEETSLILS